ncbi:CsbD family protein [Robbsia sp. KACC 23696]|uniref:CsbD family protein n=1 Tax=Robbsia sp. KACC 23696 TaxID=3149231 RepID=UPI00325B1177
MYEDQAIGTAKNLAGKAQEGIGKLIGDPATEFEGTLRQAGGALQQSYGQAIDKVSETTRINPLGSLLVAAAFGFVLGKLL